MINCGGENVYPKEVETIILTHPAVADVSVVSARHQVKGEAPVAWVVLHKGENAEERDLKQFFFANGPAYAHPRRVFFLGRNPRIRHEQNRPQVAHRRGSPPHTRRHHRRNGMTAADIDGQGCMG